jgi:hypothetical protein
MVSLASPPSAHPAAADPTLTPADRLRIVRALADDRERWLARVEPRPDERCFARVAVDAEHVHRVLNPTATPATSLHVYAPPLVTMDFYRPGPGRVMEHVSTEAALAPRSGPAELQ